MEYRVIVTKPARTDIVSIGRYIAKELHAPESAAALVADIYNEAAGLKHMPKRHALVSDERLAHLGIRLIPIKNYLIFYTVDDALQTVNIVRVLYFRRDWANLL